MLVGSFWMPMLGTMLQAGKAVPTTSSCQHSSAAGSEANTCPPELLLTADLPESPDGGCWILAGMHAGPALLPWAYAAHRCSLTADPYGNHCNPEQRSPLHGLPRHMLCLH